MSRAASPLRYPGGKACLFELVSEILSYNEIEQAHYIEPYSGGCGLALSLLFSGRVAHIHLNDLDRSIWAFWNSVISECDALVKLIEDTPLTVDEWDAQREVQLRKETADPLELGFSTFFLNRTNRSGIIHSGGIIGGRQQIGEWKMDCRFNRLDLVKRIRRINAYRGRISIYNLDAEDFVKEFSEIDSSNHVMYIDPPYYEKGSSLYKNSYKKLDHERLSIAFKNLEMPWFLTYDNIDQIRSLYADLESVEIDIGYSVHIKRTGSEILVFSDSLSPPPSMQPIADAA